MKRKLRNLFSIVMMVCMILSLLPQPAQAAVVYTPDDGHEHQWVEEPGTLPSCTEDGYHYQECIYCYLQEMITDPALGHDWSEWDSVDAPTCTETGLEIRFCHRCYLEDSHTIPALGHDWGEWHRIKEPTYTEEGIEQRECQRCGITEQRPVPKLVREESSSTTESSSTSSNSSSESSTPTESSSTPPGSSSTPTESSSDYTTDSLIPPVTVEATNPSISLALLSYKAAIGVKAGDYLDVNYLITNTGNAPVTICSTAGLESGDSTASIESNYSYMMPGDTCLVTYSYLITQTDMDNGYLTRSITEFAHEWIKSGENQIAGTTDYLSNTVTTKIPLFPADDEDPEPYHPFGWIDLHKEIISTSFFPGGYIVDEIITYRLVLSNTSIYTIGPIHVEDPLFGGTIAVDTLPPHTSASYIVDYKVTQNDVDTKSYIYNQAYAWVEGTDASVNVYSEECYADLLPWEEPQDTLIFEKYVKDEQSSYTEGETVHFILYLSNPTNKTFVNVQVYDLYSVGPVQTIPYLYPGNVIEVPFDYVVTAADTNISKLYNYGTLYTNGDYYTDSNTVFVNINVKDIPDNSGNLSVVKEITSSPANGIYYTEGESIDYKISITSHFKKEIYNVNVIDVLNFTDLTDLGTDASWGPGETREFYFSHVVTESDCINGVVTNYAEVYFDLDKEGKDNGVAFSNTVYSYTGFWEGMVSVYKMINSVPANGSFYTAGEEIEFIIAVTNGTPETITNVSLYDTCMLSGPVVIGSLNSCETFVYKYKMTVPASYAENWWTIYNVATAQYTDHNGNDDYAHSNLVEAPTGDNPFGIEWDDDDDSHGFVFGPSDGPSLTLTKAETSTPANGKYYTLNEMITYSITVTNVGTVTAGETIIYDTLSSMYSGEIGSAEHLYSGESRTYTFSYMVTEADVAAGFVKNEAFGHTTNEDNTITGFVSNPVYSPTSDTPPDGGYDFDYELITGTTHLTDDSSTSNGSGLDSCKRTLVPTEDGSIAYVVENCSEHEKIDEEILKKLEKATSEEQIAEVWKEACELWSDAIDDLYDEILSRIHASSTRMLLMNDRALFYEQLNSYYESLLLETTEAEALRIKADEMKTLCVELCYLNFSAPDSLPDDDELLKAEAVQGFCGLNSVEATREAGYEEIVMSFCDSHRMSGLAIRDLLLGLTRVGNSLRSWATIRGTWQSSLMAIMDKLMDEANGDERNAIRSESTNFMAYCNAHEALLKLVYQTDEDLDEAMTRLFMDRVLRRCEVTEIGEKASREPSPVTDRSDKGAVDIPDPSKLNEQKNENSQAAEQSRPTPETSEHTLPEIEKSKTPIGLIAGLGGGFLIAAGAVLAVILTKKKKK